MIFLLFFSFLAGIATVLSPSVLPILPELLGSSSQRKRRSLGVAFGFVVSFTFFTLAFTILIHQFGFSTSFLRYFAILFIGFLGFVLILPFWSNKLAAVTAFVANLGTVVQENFGLITGFFLGICVGFVWTPFLGPILITFTTLVDTQIIIKDIILVTVAYGLGVGLTLLFLGFSKQIFSNIPFFTNYSERIRQFFGALMLLTAVGLAFNLDATVQQRLKYYLPGILMDDNQLVEQKLNKLRPPPVEYPPVEGVPGKG